MCGDVVTPETVLPRSDSVVGARMEPAPAMAAVVSGPRSPGLVSSGNCLPPGWMFFRLPPAPQAGQR